MLPNNGENLLDGLKNLRMELMQLALHTVGGSSCFLKVCPGLLLGRLDIVLHCLHLAVGLVNLFKKRFRVHTDPLASFVHAISHSPDYKLDIFCQCLGGCDGFKVGIVALLRGIEFRIHRSLGLIILGHHFTNLFVDLGTKLNNDGSSGFVVFNDSCSVLLLFFHLARVLIAMETLKFSIDELRQLLDIVNSRKAFS